MGINCGEADGQSVFHLHVHLIPRYIGDIDNPRGGVRGVIPSRMERRDLSDHFANIPTFCVYAATPAEELFVELFNQTFALEKAQYLMNE